VLVAPGKKQEGKLLFAWGGALLGGFVPSPARS